MPVGAPVATEMLSCLLWRPVACTDGVLKVSPGRGRSGHNIVGIYYLRVAPVVFSDGMANHSLFFSKSPLQPVITSPARPLGRTPRSWRRLSMVLNSKLSRSSFNPLLSKMLQYYEAPRVRFIVKLRPPGPKMGGPGAAVRHSRRGKTLPCPLFVSCGSGPVVRPRAAVHLAQNGISSKRLALTLSISASSIFFMRG